MRFHNSIYYTVIENYEDYLTYKNNYQGILDMTESDFNTNFMVLTITENESTKNLIFHDINYDDTTLYIGLNKKISNTENNLARGISIKIDKTLLRDNSLVIYDIRYSSTTNKYYVCMDFSRDTNYSNSYRYFEFDLLEKQEDINEIFVSKAGTALYKFINNDFPETNFTISLID